MLAQILTTCLILFSFNIGVLNSTDPRPVVPSDEGISIEITPVGNELRFAQTEFTAPAGETVTLVFNNTSSAMPHNVVILTSADAIERVGMAAMAVEDYIPEDAAILAHTTVAAPGASVEVTFTAPDKPGEYPYICTVPGHFYMMKGIMKVTG